MAAGAVTATVLSRRYSLEITGKDASALAGAAPHLRKGTSVNVTFLGNEDQQARSDAHRAALECGFRPVPHLSARRLGSLREFEAALEELQDIGANEEIFAVGGDPTQPLGPFEDALSLIRTGLLAQYGIRHVGITGYPEGHPHIDDDELWRALGKKVSALKEQSLAASITTQFGFDAQVVADWIIDARRRGFDVPIRVGVPGPVSVRRLLAYARRFGVKSSAGVVAKYGLSLANLVGSAGPDRFITDLATALTPEHGEVTVHFYTFGDVAGTAKWIAGQGVRA